MAASALVLKDAQILEKDIHVSTLVRNCLNRFQIIVNNDRCAAHQFFWETEAGRLQRWAAMNKVTTETKEFTKGHLNLMSRHLQNVNRRNCLNPRSAEEEQGLLNEVNRLINELPTSSG